MANKKHLEILKQGVKIWNEWRLQNPNTIPDLKSAKLKNADLTDAHFFRANLSGANLTNARLERADFTDANLISTNLRGAHLELADFTGADLINTKFSNADLKSVKLINARLSGAQLVRANLKNARLINANLTDTNLTSALLSNALLSGAKLINANLTSADLSDANLVDAFLSHADLFNAILKGADFTNANLKDSNLGDADLTNANLMRANLSDADLTNANLADALLGWTILGITNLTDVRNLESCRHAGPSIVGHQTLIRSGRLPEIFLRGCGLSDEFINYIPLLFWTSKALEFYSCFISYSHADESFARRLHDHLQGRGIRCWLDRKQILPGDDIYEQIDRGIKLWDKLLLCCSRHSLTSWWVDNEIDTAFEMTEHAKNRLRLKM